MRVMETHNNCAYGRCRWRDIFRSGDIRKTRIEMNRKITTDHFLCTKGCIFQTSRRKSRKYWGSMFSSTLKCEWELAMDGSQYNSKNSNFPCGRKCYKILRTPRGRPRMRRITCSQSSFTQLRRRSFLRR